MKGREKKNQTRPSSPQQVFTHNSSFVEGRQVERPCGEPRRGRRLSVQPTAGQTKMTMADKTTTTGRS